MVPVGLSRVDVDARRLRIERPRAAGTARYGRVARSAPALGARSVTKRGPVWTNVPLRYTGPLTGQRMDASRFEGLSERQREYLRLVFQHRNSQEIAFLKGVSARAVDKQLLCAKTIIGATSRFEAARRFAEYEAGVEGFYPASVAPSQRRFWPLPLPVPTRARAENMLGWRQVLAWGVIIAIATPLAITVAAMLIVALALLFGIHLR